MNRLYKLIFHKNIKKQKALVSALDEFIQQFYWGEGLKQDESRKNLEEGIIEITHYGNHSSQGILITEDGYFLTAKHCIDKDLPEKRIRLFNGRTYSIEKVCAYDTEDDAALAKANIQKSECNSKKYRIFNTNKLEKNIPIAIMTRWDKKLKTSYGSITRTWSADKVESSDGQLVSYHNHFELNVFLKPGNSGGIVVSPDGRLIGMLSSGNENYNHSSGIKIIKAFELIESYKRKIQERLL